MNIKNTLLLYTLCVPLLTVANTAAAYPDRSVKIVVSNAAGGPVDIMARMLAEKLGKNWKQPVVIENKPGASGIITASNVAKSRPDGYTLGMIVASTVTIVPFATSHMPIDPQKDLKPVSMVARTPFIFIVPEDSPIQSWKDFVAASKQKEVTLGSFSIGTAYHLVWEQIANKAGIKAMYVPSSSSGKTQNDMIGGQLDAALDAPSSAKGLLDGGRIRAIAVTGEHRFAGLPKVPTLKEVGLDFAAEPWIGLMVPAGVPDEIVNQIQQSLKNALADPELEKRMQSVGMVPQSSTAQEFGDTIMRDRQMLAPIIKKLNIRLD